MTPDAAQIVDPYHEPKYVLFCGVTGSGKTHLAAAYAEQIARPFVVILHVSPDLVYLSRFPAEKTKLVSLDSSAHIVRPEVFDTVRASGIRYLYLSAYDLTPSQIREMLSSLVLSAKASQDLALVIDEAHTFARRGYAPPSLVGFSRGARRWGVDIAWVTQRYVDIDPDIRTNFGYMALFRMPQELDREKLATEVNRPDLDADALAEIPLRSFVFCDLRIGGVTAPQTL